MGASLKYGLSPWLMLFMTFTGMSAFYIAHWQTYVTGTLTFGKIDVTEAQLTIYIIYFLTAILGDTLWSLRVSSLSLTLSRCVRRLFSITETHLFPFSFNI